MTVPSATFEVADGGEHSFAGSVGVPESVRSRLAAAEQADDEPDVRLVEPVQVALRAHGEGFVRGIVADPDRRRAAAREGHLVHEVAGREVQGLITNLPEPT